MGRFRYLLSLIVLSLSVTSCGDQQPAYSETAAVSESSSSSAMAKESNGKRDNAIHVLTPEASIPMLMRLSMPAMPPMAMLWLNTQEMQLR